MTVTAVEIPIRDQPPKLFFRFEVDFNEASATVLYRPARTVDRTDSVLTIRHCAGRGLQVDWVEHWRAYLSQQVRGAVVAEVRQILIHHYQ